jgi:hypothetical protein
MGVRHALLPVLALGAPRGCQLPDAILHGKRSHRPRSRAVQRFAVAGFRVRLFSSLGLVVAPPACEPGKDTSVTAFSASSPLSARSAPAFGGTFARCHGSRLLTLRLLFIHRSAAPFLTPPTFRKVFTGLAWTRVLPDASAHFVPPFGVFHLADPAFTEPPESPARADTQ